jgi:hypothetical protein
MFHVSVTNKLAGIGCPPDAGGQKDSAQQELTTIAIPTCLVPRNVKERP